MEVAQEFDEVLLAVRGGVVLGDGAEQALHEVAHGTVQVQVRGEGGEPRIF